MSSSHACIGCLFKFHSIHWPIHVLIAVSWYLRSVDHFRTKRVLRIIYIFSDGSNAFFFHFGANESNTHWPQQGLFYCGLKNKPMKMLGPSYLGRAGPHWPKEPVPIQQPITKYYTWGQPVMRAATNGTAELETVLNTSRDVSVQPVSHYQILHLWSSPKPLFLAGRE